MSVLPLRRSLAAVALIATGLALPAVQAATTTYNSATNISSIADGDTAVLVNGGSLTEPLLDFNNTGILEFDLTDPLTVTTRFTDFGTVVKKNTGTVTLDANNSLFPAYQGAFVIEGGTLTIGQNSAGTPFGNSPTLTFQNGGGTLASGYNAAISVSSATVLDSTAQSTTATFTNQGQAFFGVQGAISGTGSLALQSAGTGAVSGSNYVINNPISLSPSTASTFTGNVGITGGIVTLGVIPSVTGGQLGNATNVVTIDGGGLGATVATGVGVTVVTNPVVLALGGGQFAAIGGAQTARLQFNNTISGTGSFSRVGGTVFLNAANTFSGDTYLGATSIGALNLAHADAGGGFDLSALAASDNPVFSGIISGTGNITIAANGETAGASAGGTALTGVNTYTGSTTITSGVVTAANSFGDAGNTVVLDGGGLFASAGTVTNAYAVSLASASGSLRAETGATLVQSGAISGTGTLLATDSGTVQLSAANTNSGDVRIVAGTLEAANVDALQDATLDMNVADSGTISFTVGGSNTYAIGGLEGSRNIAAATNTLAVGGNGQSTAYSVVLSGTGGLTKEGSGTLTLSGANSYGGTTRRDLQPRSGGPGRHAQLCRPGTRAAWSRLPGGRPGRGGRPLPPGRPTVVRDTSSVSQSSFPNSFNRFPFRKELSRG